MSYVSRDRFGTYYFRRTIPPELRSYMPEPWTGKREWKQTLSTKDPQAAKRRSIPRLQACQRDFDLAAIREERSIRDSLSDEEIQTLADWYRDEQVLRDRDFWETGHRADETRFEKVGAALEPLGAIAAFPRFSGRGLSPRQQIHKAEPAAFLADGIRDPLARGDTSVVEPEVDAVLEAHGIQLPRDGFPTGASLWRSYRLSCNGLTPFKVGYAVT